MYGLSDVDRVNVLDFGWVRFVLDASKGEEAPHATQAMLVV